MIILAYSRAIEMPCDRLALYVEYAKGRSISEEEARDEFIDIQLGKTKDDGAMQLVY